MNENPNTVKTADTTSSVTWRLIRLATAVTTGILIGVLLMIAVLYPQTTDAQPVRQAVLVPESGNYLVTMEELCSEGFAATLIQDGTVTAKDLRISTRWSESSVEIRFQDDDNDFVSADKISIVGFQPESGDLRVSRLGTTEKSAYFLDLLVKDWQSLRGGTIQVCML